MAAVAAQKLSSLRPLSWQDKFISETSRETQEDTREKAKREGKIKVKIGRRLKEEAHLLCLVKLATEPTRIAYSV